MNAFVNCRDSFDLESFFQLHDLNRYERSPFLARVHAESAFRDGVWDREEIEAIYGVHHVYSQKKSKVPQPPSSALLVLILCCKDEIEHQKKADHVVDTILKLMDKKGDGKITPEEFEAAGFKGLPSFDDIGAEGHHYDVESGMSFVVLAERPSWN